MQKHKRGGKNKKPYRGIPTGIEPNRIRNLLRECQEMQRQREESRRERMSRAYHEAGYDGAEDSHE